MLEKIIFKNFKFNIKKYILFFISNIVAVMELFVFCGIRDIVKEAVTDKITAIAMQYDFRIAAGLVTIITIFLMIYSLQNYVRLRIHDYSTFLVLGMKKRICYFLILAEYCMGWLCSMLLGVLLGQGILYGIQRGLHIIYPEFVQAQAVGSTVYKNTILLSAGIMILVFLGLIIWMDNKNLSSLMMTDDVKERTFSTKWNLLCLVGGVLVGIAFYEYQGSDMAYLSSHVIWGVGGVIIMVFGGGAALNWVQKKNSFYKRHLIQMNQLYHKYLSNTLILTILFVIHFLSLGYLTTELAGSLPLNHYRDNYPYDMIWMAQEKDLDIAEQVTEKYEGEVIHIPMIRVTTMYGAEQIGVSAANYVKLAKEPVELKGREILVGIENQKFRKRTKVTDSDFWRVYQWLYMGKYTPKMEDLDMLSNDSEQVVTVKNVYTQNLIGQYSIDQWFENMVVFSDEYFQSYYSKTEKDPQEPSVLMMFHFPEKNRKTACAKLHKYIEKEGVKEDASVTRAQMYYETDRFLRVQKMRVLFGFASKAFIIISLLISGAFVVGLKTISEITEFRRRYEFLSQMGMKQKNRRKNIRFEVQSLSVISCAMGLIMAIFYVVAYEIRLHNTGANQNNRFWYYWMLIVGSYIALQYLIGAVFSEYVKHEIEKGS